MAVVLEEFEYAVDGINTETLKVGDNRDFGNATDGLVQAGKIAGAAVQETAPAPEPAPEPEPEAAVEDAPIEVAAEQAEETAAKPSRKGK